MAHTGNVQVFMGDMFESRAQTLVNTVNCVGVMGKGVALEFKKRYPEMFEDYAQRCKRHEVRLGRPYLFRYLTGPWILNFPTKDHWRSVTNLNDIVNGLEYLLDHYQEWGIKSLAVPPLGCGNGQLEWRVVGPTLYRYLGQFEIPVDLFAPHGTPHSELQPAFLAGEQGGNGAANEMPDPTWIEPAWVALADIVRRIEEQPYHPPVGRTKFQKIAFIATTQGLPTGLEFVRGSYGPFARGLKRIEGRLINNGLIAEKANGNMIRIHAGQTLRDASVAYEHELKCWDEVLERIADLFMRIDTHQSEIVSSVIFASNEIQGQMEGKPTELDVLKTVMDWKQRRRPSLDESEVAFTIRNLASLGWLDVDASSELLVDDELSLYA